MPAIDDGDVVGLADDRLAAAHGPHWIDDQIPVNRAATGPRREDIEIHRPSQCIAQGIRAIRKIVDADQWLSSVAAGAASALCAAHCLTIVVQPEVVQDSLSELMLLLLLRHTGSFPKRRGARCQGLLSFAPVARSAF